jgi:hypothetical protein
MGATARVASVMTGVFLSLGREGCPSREYKTCFPARGRKRLPAGDCFPLEKGSEEGSAFHGKVIEHNAVYFA